MYAKGEGAILLDMDTMIDLHCDTIYHVLDDHKDFVHNDLSVDIEKLEANHRSTQCFAMFVHLGRQESPWKRVNELHDEFVRQMELHKDRICQVRTAREIHQNQKCGAILTTEEGGILEGELGRVATLASWGVRSFTLTWNFENELAWPNSKDPIVMAKGLKEKGIEAVGLLEQNHIIVDVSHLNDGGFWDVVKYSTKPFWASHSNARAVTGATRNMSDSMIRALSDKGGVMGLNFCPSFLSDDGLHESRVDDMVRHVLHERNVGGSQVLAIGTDFDGIGGTLELKSVAEMDRLRDRLAKAGLSQSELDAMWSGNALRVLSA